MNRCPGDDPQNPTGMALIDRNFKRITAANGCQQFAGRNSTV